MEFGKVSLKYRQMIFLVICVILLTFNTGCDAKKIRATEGEEITLSFLYPCNSTRVTFRYGNRAVSFDSLDPESLSLPSNQKLIKYNGTQRGNCAIDVVINPVKRDDSGTYILTLYEEGDFIDDRKIGLHVYYPPGRVSCVSSSEYIDDEWMSLLCTASAGNLHGQIMCYQNGIKLPSLAALYSYGRHISKKIWARLEDSGIYCCSSFFGQRKDICDCKDWGWNPIQDCKLTNITDPCSVYSDETMTTGNVSITLPSKHTISNLPHQEADIDIISGFRKNGVLLICTCILAFLISAIIMWHITKVVLKLIKTYMYLRKFPRGDPGNENRSSEEEKRSKQNEMSVITQHKVTRDHVLRDKTKTRLKI